MLRRHLQLRRALLSAALTIGLALSADLVGPRATKAEGGSSLRFYGSGSSDLDRVKIPLGPISNGQITASRPVNVGGGFTIEFWMQASAANNAAGACGAGWYYGNIIVDRDVFGAGDYGDYGVAVCAGRVVFGVNDALAVGTKAVTDSAWHHIAVTRVDDGQLRIFVDGALDVSQQGPAGRVDYRTNRATSWPESDPYLVFGAEKHDYAGSLYYNGLLDDVRISSIARYSASFTRPSAPHAADANTVALYRFDEGTGTAVGDASGAAGGPSGGTLNPRGGGAAQHWSAETPFGSNPNPSPSTSPSVGPSTSPSVSPSVSPSAAPTPRSCAGIGSTSSLAFPAAPTDGTPLPLPFGAAKGEHRLFLPYLACQRA